MAEDISPHPSDTPPSSDIPSGPAAETVHSTEDDSRLEGEVAPHSPSGDTSGDPPTRSTGPSDSRHRQGKAPPIQFLSAEDPAVLLDDWLPSLERASSWNGWSEKDKLMQLPGYLRGQALQEWRLLHRSEQQSHPRAVSALRARLDPGSKTMAAQDFSHSVQRSGEPVTDFIRRLEKTYQIAYGKDNMNVETRDALLYGQLYEGLRYDIMLSPAVSGSQGYKELCTAAKGEERRLTALKQRQQYFRTPNTSTPPLPRTVRPSDSQPKRQAGPTLPTGQATISDLRRCYNCGKTGHFSLKCPQPKRESKGRQVSFARTKQVRSRSCARINSESAKVFTPEKLLFSSSEEEDEATQVNSVRIADKGSVTKCVKVHVQGVPAYGLIDSGADITIIGGALFKKVATVARLKRRNLLKPDKVPRTYDQQPFTLDGRMDLDLAFGEKQMVTPVYIKMDAHDQLLLSEGVCRQLGIIQYRPDVESARRRQHPPLVVLPTRWSHQQVLLEKPRCPLFE